MYRSDLEALQQNACWREIVQVLKETEKGLLEDIAEILPFEEGVVKLAQQQGRLKMLKFVLYELPADFEEEIKMNERRGEESKHE